MSSLSIENRQDKIMELIKQEIRNFIITNYMPKGGRPLGDNDSLQELGIVDSTGVLELVCFLQEQFSIEIDDELSPENLDSVSNLTHFVSAKLAA
jgi:acyl carrier protein